MSPADESPELSQLRDKLRAQEETIAALKEAAAARAEGLGGGMLGVRKAMANLQNSLAERSRELEATLTRYRALFDHSPLMGLTVDHQGRITTANRSAEENLDPQADSPLRGRHWPELFEASSAARLQDMIAGGVPDTRDLVLTSGRLVESVVAPVPGYGETQLLFADVTEHRSVEERLRHAQKMDALGRLAGGVAHDFNNLLSAIIGYTELIQARPDPERVASFSTEVLGACKRAADLIKHLLAFSRSEPTSLEPLDLNEVASNVGRIASRTFDRRITVELRLEASESHVLGDSSLLESAILNLAINARDAMPNGGTLTIATKNTPMPTEVQPRACSSRPDDAIELCMADDGEGMDAEVLARMFDPFFTTKPQGRGTGLGLAATYGTVQRHKGTIRVHSLPDKGTSFCLYLPLSSKPAPETLESEPLAQDSLSVLVIDDEPAVRHTTCLLLESLGHRARTAEDGASGLRALAQDPELDLLLLDLMLPDMHGNQVLASLRASGNRIPVLVISGYSSTDCGPGADGFLRKPFTRAELAQAIGGLT